jgi:tellurite resistance protein
VEVLIFIGVLLFGGTVIRLIWKATVGTAVATTRAATGQGSFSSNMAQQWRGMGEWEVRYEWGDLGDDGSIRAVIMQARGILPLNYSAHLGYVTSVFDVTDGESKPVICALDQMQEQESIVFNHSLDAGRAEPDSGYADWSQIGVVPVDFLVPPVSGLRQLTIVTRLVDLRRPPTITHGYADPDGATIFGSYSVDVNYDFGSNKGYEQDSEERDEAMSLSLRLAVAVAMSDGEWSESEGEHLYDWIVKTISAFSGDRHDSLKTLLNDSLRDAHGDALEGRLSVTTLVDRMNEISERSEKFEAVELAIDVMAADGVASAEEVAIIRGISDQLGLDYDEVSALTDQRLVSMESFSDNIDTEALLGIEDDWTDEQKQRHLAQEYVKWSNRTASLSDEQELNNARRMLETIAALRQQYGE